jgi:hypothetical protein
MVVLVLFAGGFAGILGVLVWLARRVRRSGVGAGLMGPIDEIYHPGAHRSRLEIQVASQQAQPPAGPSDGFRPAA